MNETETVGTNAARRPPRWRKHRLAFLAGGIAMWFGGIAVTHHRAQANYRGTTTKGARELLQIGALPVT
jgi:hypothetical protein